MSKGRQVKLGSGVKSQIEEIFWDSLHQWGEKVAEDYIELIQETFNYLSEFAENGQKLE